jgi:hypothetical protein
LFQSGRAEDEEFQRGHITFYYRMRLLLKKLTQRVCARIYVVGAC